MQELSSTKSLDMTYQSDRPLDIELTTLGSSALLKMHGSVRMADVDVMRAALEDLTDGKVTAIILDMSDLDFICSTGLGTIISGHLRMRHHEGRICLVAPKPFVMTLLETTRLTELFAVFATVEQAMA